MKTKLFLFCVASLLICMGCQKESATLHEPPPGVVAAAVTCADNCTQCTRVNGKCTCLFDRFDRSASNLARLSIEDRLKHFKRPIVAKVRCVPQDADHMYNGLEYYVVITGTGGPDTYYTYMDLKIENPSFRDLACDTQRNRFYFEGSDRPLRNPNGAYGACAYIVTEVF